LLTTGYRFYFPFAQSTQFLRNSLTGFPHISCLTDTDGITGTTITNIIGNGHTVYYDKDTCPELGGQVYTLSGRGTLQPES
jgi:hypothetical protein